MSRRSTLKRRRDRKRRKHQEQQKQAQRLPPVRHIKTANLFAEIERRTLELAEIFGSDGNPKEESIDSQLGLPSQIPKY